MDRFLCLLFLPSLLAVVVILVIHMKDTFTTPKTQPKPEPTEATVAPVLTPTETQA